MINADWHERISPEFLAMVIGVAVMAGRTAQDNAGASLSDDLESGLIWLEVNLPANNRLAQTFLETGWIADRKGLKFYGLKQDASFRVKKIGFDAMKTVLQRFGIPSYSFSIIV